MGFILLFVQRKQKANEKMIRVYENEESWQFVVDKRWERNYYEDT